MLGSHISPDRSFHVRLAAPAGRSRYSISFGRDGELTLADVGTSRRVVRTVARAIETELDDGIRFSSGNVP